MNHQDHVAFAIAGDGIDPRRIPQRTLYTGATMPAIGMGTFGSDHASADMVAAVVRGGISVGYRHIDCAAVYGNEAEIGQVFEEVLDSGAVSRQEMWITSKLWNDKHTEEDVIPTFKKSLADLRLDHLDLYLIHWPFPNHHPPGAHVTSRTANAKPYIHESYMKTWRQLEKTFTATTDGSRLYMYSGKQATVWFDNIQIVPVQ